jgi:hypothetical protein
MMTGFSGGLFTFQVGSNLALGLLFFLFAWAVFEKFCAEQKESAPGRAGVAPSHGRRRRLFSPGRSWKLALAWKDFYFTTGGKLWIVIKLAVYGMPLLVTRCWPRQLGGPPPWTDFGIGVFWFMIIFIGVEFAFAAATIFRNERQGQTLSSLAMLPQGIRRVAYEKLLGVIPSLAAAGAYLVLSLPLVAKRILVALSNPDTDLHWIHLLFMMAQAAFFLHLVAILSLYVKRGALPLAIAVQFLLSIFTGITFEILFRDDSGFVVLFLLTLIATAFLHFHIGQRLEAISAED